MEILDWIAASDLRIFLEVTDKNSNNPFDIIPPKAGTQFFIFFIHHLGQSVAIHLCSSPRGGYLTDAAIQFNNPSTLLLGPRLRGDDKKSKGLSEGDDRGLPLPKLFHKKLAHCVSRLFLENTTWWLCWIMVWRSLRLLLHRIFRRKFTTYYISD